MTHFDVFGLPPRYALDERSLEKRHRALALELHPDRQGKADAHARRVSLERTTALNDAYRVLKDPVRRAFYLLALAGVDLDREGGGSGPRDLPLEFLEEVLDLREALAIAKAAKDLAGARALSEQVEEKKAAALQAAVENLELLEQMPGNRAAITKASHQLSRVRYFNRFLEEAEGLLEEAL
ncbi:MAG: Fe-S protein assembly co-chaperone HscB [Myxococcaceae bacterium]